MAGRGGVTRRGWPDDARWRFAADLGVDGRDASAAVRLLPMLKGGEGGGRGGRKLRRLREARPVKREGGGRCECVSATRRVFGGK